MENIEIQIVEFNSVLQKKSIELRTKILREPLGLAFTAEELAEEVNQIHIVATNKEAVIGVLVLKIMSDTLLKMRQVAVDFDLQKIGIGKKMIEFSEEYAKSNNYKKLELHARDVAKEFYLKLGYDIVGDEFMEVGIPHSEMVKLF